MGGGGLSPDLTGMDMQILDPTQMMMMIHDGSNGRFISRHNGNYWWHKTLCCNNSFEVRPIMANQMGNTSTSWDLVEN